ncbi:MAG: acylphosphatase [Sutterella wadsworthensis]
MTKAATDFRVRGLVQGVGFRPTVYRIALELGLSGTVWNDAEGVVVHLEGESEVLERFPEALLAGKPPLARIDAVEPAAGELPGHGGLLHFRHALRRPRDHCRHCRRLCV